MQTITKYEYRVNKDMVLRKILKGDIFIYPTDTIYGIGCDATNDSAVKKLRKAKDRYDKAFSVIAPSKNWIYLNCKISAKVRDWIDKIPGPYTLILKLVNKDCVAKSVILDNDTIGVRIPNSWFNEIPRELDRPIVTTSANIIGGDFMTSLEDLSKDVENKTDFILYQGAIEGKPSRIVDLSSDNEKVLRK